MHRAAANLTTGNLIRFTFPSILMMVFLSLYTMVDGVFVARFIGEDALAAVNIVFPLASFVIAVGVMLATGGNAIVAKNLGEGNNKLASRNLSLIYAAGIGAGLLIVLLGLIFLNPLINMLGSTPKLYDYTYGYLKLLIFASPFYILQSFSQCFLVTAGHPRLGLYAIILGGVINIVLDYVFIVPMNMGIEGAALATGIGAAASGLVGLMFFFKTKGVLCFTKFRWKISLLAEACFNGSSEMVANLSAGVITAAFNIIMLQRVGEQGVAAITVLLYAQFLLTAVFMGFSMGISPLFSYTYGSGEEGHTKKLFKFSIAFILISSLFIYGGSFLLSDTLIGVFLSRSSPTFTLAKEGFLLFSLSFIFTGLNIFASALFTAFSNGVVSALLSFLRTFVFIIGALILLPVLLGINGVWLAVPLAELLALAISFIFVKRYREVYRY